MRQLILSIGMLLWITCSVAMSEDGTTSKSLQLELKQYEQKVRQLEDKNNGICDSGDSLLYSGEINILSPEFPSSGSLEVDGLAIIPNDNAGTFDITATSGAHGTVTPGGVTTLSLGASQTYTITPNTGYTIATLTVDGNSITPAASYSFSNVQADHTISAIFSADTTAPSVPADLSASAISATQVNLTWTASTDDTAVTGYRVYRNGTQVATSVTNSYSDSGLTASTQYAYTVAAYDAAGNVSTHCVAVNVTTQAATGLIYYVSPSSVSTDWPAAKNISTPCTVQTAFNNAVAGDTVQFRGGTYTVPARNTGDWLTGYYAPNNSGTASAPIVFMAYPGEIPVFDGTSGGAVDKDAHGYYHFSSIMSNARYDAAHERHIFNEYITFDGLYFQCDGGVNEVRIALTGGDSYSSNPRVKGLIVQNCTFNGGTWVNEDRVCDVNNVCTGTRDNREGIFVSQTTGLIIRNCKLFGYLHATNYLNTSAIKTYHSDNLVVEHCEIYNTSRAMFSKTNTDTVTFRYNYVHNADTGFYLGTGGWWNDRNDHSKGYHVNENTDNVLYHNLFVNNKASISILTQDGADADGFIAYNNTIYGVDQNTTATVSLSSGERQHYYNNIQYGRKKDNDLGLLKWSCGTNNPQDIADGMAEFNFGLDSADHNQFGDYPGSFLLRVRKPNESTINYSTLAAWQTSGVLTDNSNPGAGSLVSDPLFVNASGNMNTIADFALQANSPCKGAGRGGVDMGADISRVGILSSLPSDTTAPSAPANLVGTARE